MATPNTADIYFELNDFLKENEGLYIEIHQELERQGLELNQDNFNDVIAEQGLMSKNVAPASEKYIEIASKLSPPKLDSKDLAFSRISQEQHDAAIKDTEQVFVESAKPEKRVTESQTNVLLDKLFGNINKLAVKEAEQDYQRDVNSGKYNDDELKVRRALYNSAYRSYRLTHIGKFYNSQKEIRTLVDDIFKDDLTVDNYAEKFHYKASDSELQDFINTVKLYNVWAEDKGFSPLNPADPFIARLPSGSLPAILEETALASYLNAQEVIDKRVEELAKEKYRGEVAWENLPNNEKEGFLRDTRKNLRGQLSKDPDLERELQALIEQVDPRSTADLFDFEAYQEAGKIVTDIENVALQIEDSAVAEKATEFFNRTEPERESLLKDTQRRLMAWQDFANSLVDSGFYDSFPGETTEYSLEEKFDNAFLNMRGYGAPEGAMNSAQELGITDYASFVRVTQELFDAQLENSKRLTPQMHRDSWETGFEMEERYDPLVRFSLAARRAPPNTLMLAVDPVGFDDIALNTANLDVLLPDGTSDDDLSRQLARELEKEIQFNYAETHAEWKDFLISTFGADERTLSEKIEDMNPFELKDEGVKEIDSVQTQANYYADIGIKLQEQLNKATTPDEREKLQKQIDNTEALRKKYSLLSKALIQKDGTYFDVFGIRSGAEVGLYGFRSDFVFKDALQELEATESKITDDLLEVISTLTFYKNKQETATEEDLQNIMARRYEDYFNDVFLAEFFEKIDLDKERGHYTADDDVIKELTGIAVREYYKSIKYDKESAVLKVFLSQDSNLSEVKQLLRIEEQSLSDMLQTGGDPSLMASIPIARQIVSLNSADELQDLALKDVKIKDLPPDLRKFFPDLGPGATIEDAIETVDFEGLRLASARLDAGAKHQHFARDTGEIIQYVSSNQTIDLDAGTVTSKPSLGMFMFETGLSGFEVLVSELPYALSIDDIYDPLGYLGDNILPGAPSMADVQGGGWDSWMDEWARRSTELKGRGAGGYVDGNRNPIHPMSWMFDSAQVGEELLQYIKDNYNKQLELTGQTETFDIKPKISYDQLMEWTKEFVRINYEEHYERSLPFMENAYDLFGAELAVSGTNILDHIPYAISGVLTIPGTNTRIPIGGIAGMEYHMERYAADYYNPTRDLSTDYLFRLVDSLTYLDGDMMQGQQQIARGFGISSGPTYNTYTALGNAQAVMMDYEGMAFGAASTIVRVSLAGGSTYKIATDLTRAQRGVNAFGAGLYEFSPLVGGFFLEVAGPADPVTGKVARNTAVYEGVVDSINNDTYFDGVARPIIETITSGAIGYFIGETPGMLLGAAMFNPAVSRFFFHLYDVTDVGKLDKYYQQLGVEGLLMDNNYLYRDQALERGENYIVNSINPNRKRSTSDFERSDLIDVIYNRTGLNRTDAAVELQNLALANKRTIMTLADALIRGDEQIVNAISNKLDQRFKERKKQGLGSFEGLFGMYIGLQKTNGYKKAQRDLIAVANRTGNDIGNTDFQLAQLAVGAYLSGVDPEAFFKSFRIDELGFTGIDFELLRQTFPEGASLKDLLDSLDATVLWREEAYYKSLGLYDHLDGLLQQDSIKIQQVLDFIKDAQDYTFTDNYDFKVRSGVDYNAPSEKMKGYNRAFIEYGDNSAHVFYKVQNGRVKLGEIHISKPEEMASPKEDTDFRLRVSKILTAEKMKEGKSKFGWDTDDVFHQLQEPAGKQKELFDLMLRRYFDNFTARKTREDRFFKGAGKSRSASISSEVIESYLEHIEVMQVEEGIRTRNPRNVGKSFYVQAAAELPVHPRVERQDLDKNMIADAMINQSDIVLQNKETLEQLDGVSAQSFVDEIKKTKNDSELLKYFGKNKNIFDYNQLKKDIEEKGFEAVKEELTLTKVSSIIRKAKVKASKNISEAAGRVESAIDIVEIVDPDLHIEILEEDLLSFEPKWEEAYTKIKRAGIDLAQGRPRVTAESKFYRGRTRNEIIMENGNSHLLFRQAEFNNSRIMFLDAVNTPSSSGIVDISTIYAEIEIAKLIRDKKTRDKTIQELRSKLSSARSKLAINPPKELNDLFGDARMALRELLQSNDRPDFIGYQADNLAYGSKIRSELKQAGIEFKEMIIKDPDGVPFRIISLTDLMQNKLATEGLPIVPPDLDPALSSLGLDVEFLLSTETPEQSGVNVKNWLGLAADADVDELTAKLEQNRQLISTIYEDTYAGFSRQEIQERIDEGTIPAEISKEMKAYMDATPTTQNYAFVKDGVETQFSVDVSNNELFINTDAEMNDIQIRNIVFEATKDGRSAVHFNVEKVPEARSTLESLKEAFDSEVTTEGTVMRLEINQNMSYAAPVRLTPLFAKTDGVDALLEFYAESPTTLYHLSASEKRSTLSNNDGIPGGMYRPNYFAEDVIIYQDKNDVWRIADYENGKRTTRRTGKFSGASKQEAIDQIKSERLVNTNETDLVGVMPIVKSVDETIKILHQELLYHVVIHTPEGKIRRLAIARKKQELASRTIELSTKESYLEGSTVVINHADGQFASLSEIDLLRNSGAKSLILATPTKKISISGEVTNPDANFFELTRVLEKDFDSLTTAESDTMNNFLNKVIDDMPEGATEGVDIGSSLVERYQDALAEELRATGLDVTIQEHKFENIEGTYVTKPERTGSLDLDYQFKQEGFGTTTGKTEKKKLKEQKLASLVGEEKSRVILKSENQIRSKLRRAYRSKNVRDYTFAGVEHYEKMLDLPEEGIPDFIQQITDNVSTNLNKFKEGKLSYRDTLVAYFTSVMSQQAAELPLEQLQKTLADRNQLNALNAVLGQTISAETGVNFGFIDAKGTVRMEDMAGAWFVTPKGQAFLDSFEMLCHFMNNQLQRATVATKKTIKKSDAERLGLLNTLPSKRELLAGERLKALEESKLPALAEEETVEVFYKHPPKGDIAQVNRLRKIIPKSRFSALEDLYNIRSAHPTPSNNLKMYWDKNANIDFQLSPENQTKFTRLQQEYNAISNRLDDLNLSLDKATDKNAEDILRQIDFEESSRKDVDNKMNAILNSAKLEVVEFEHIDFYQLAHHIIQTTDRMNILGKKYTGGVEYDSLFAKDVHNAARTLRGIGEVKAPFLSMQLGFGVMVTADAQEIRALIGLDPDGKPATVDAKKNKKIRTNISSFSEAGTRGKTLDGRTIDQVYQDAIMERFKGLRQSLSERGIELPDENWPAIIHQMVWSSMKKYIGQEKAQNAMYAGFQEINTRMGSDVFNFLLQSMSVPLGLQKSLTQFRAAIELSPNSLNGYQLQVLKTVLEKIPDDRAKDFLTEVLNKQEFITGKTIEELPELPVDYDIDVSRYTNGTTEAKQKKFLIDRGLTQTVDDGQGKSTVAGSFINTGEVLKISLGELADVATFFHEFGHLIRHLLTPEQYDQIARRFDHVVVNGKARMTRRGEEQFAEAFEHTQMNEFNSADPVIQRAMKETKTNLQQVLLLTESARVSRGALGKMSDGMKKLFSDLIPFSLLNRQVEQVMKPNNKMNIDIAREKLQGVITSDAVEGIAKATAEGPIPFKQAFLQAGDVFIRDGAMRAEQEAKLQRATNALSQRVYRTSQDELIRDLRPSQYPSIRDKSKLGPSRQRAKENIAKREGLEVDQVRDIDVTPEEIDLAFFDLVNEGKPVDLLDFYARIESYADFRQYQASANLRYSAITQRTIVRQEQREEYSKRARIKMEEIFGESMDDLAERFGKDAAYDELPDLSSAERQKQKKQNIPYVELGPDVKARLSHLIDVTHSIPGRTLMDGNFVDRVKNSEDPNVKIYITDITDIIRPTIIDNAAPIAARRSNSLETGSVTAVHSILKTIDSLVFKNKKVTSKLLDNVAFDFLFEKYNPRISSMARTQNLDVRNIDPRVLEVLNNLQAELRALPQEIEMILSLLEQENTLKAIERAEKVYGENLTPAKKKDLKKIGVGMMETSRRLQRMLNAPVDPVRIPQLRNIVNRIKGIREGVIARDFELELDAEDASIKVQTMMDALEKIGDPMTEPYKVIRQYLNKDQNQKLQLTDSELNALEDAQDQLVQRYRQISSTREVLSLETWQSGFLAEVNSILGPDKTFVEQEASIAFEKFLAGYNKEQPLTPEQTKEVRKNISILLTALERKDFQVRRKGELLFKSASGLRDLNKVIDPEDAYRAYTMFFQGKIAIGDLDLKRMESPNRFELDKPPNGDSWTHHDLINIYKQFGYREGEAKASDASKNARADIEERFGIKDITKLTEDEIVQYSNEVSRMPPQDTGFFRATLIGMAKDRGDVKLSQTPKIDMGMIMLEMVVRLMAEEKLAEASSKIAEIHVYGDLQKAAREKMIELGFEPLSEEKVFIDRVSYELEQWVTQGANPKLMLDGGLLTYKHQTPPEPSILAAQQVASEIISTYGISPGSKQKMARFTSPDGVEYIVPEGIDKLLEDLTDQVAPVGVASDKIMISPKEIFERKSNTRRMQQNLARSEDIKNKMVELIIDDYPQLEKARKDLRLLVDAYIIEQDPSYPKLRQSMNNIDQIKNAEIDELFGETLSKAAEEYLKTTMGRPLLDKLPPVNNLLPRIRRQYKLGEEVTFQLNIKQELAEAELTSEYIKQQQKKLVTEEAEPDYDAAPDRITPEFEPKNRTRVFVNDLKNFLALGIKRFAVSKRFSKSSMFLDFIETYMRLKKRLVTTGMFIPTAAYYINNMFGAIFQGYLEGGIQGLSSNLATAATNPMIYTQAFAYLYPTELGGLGRRGKRGEKVFVTSDGRIYTAETLANEAQKHGIGGAFITTELGESVVEDLRRNNPEGMYKFIGLGGVDKAIGIGKGWVDTWSDLASATDNGFRLAMFMDELNKGKSGADAAKTVRDAYYDYASLTDAEKKYLRQIFLFYAYMRKNQIQVLRALRDNPARVMGTLRFIRNSQREATSQDERGYDYRKLPSYLRSRLLRPAGTMDFQGGHDVYYYENLYGQKVHIYPMIGVADFALMTGPAIDGLINIFKAEGLEEKGLAFFQSAAFTTKYFAGQASPPLQMAYELAAQQKIFADLPLERMRVSQTQIDLINANYPLFNVPSSDTSMNEGLITLVESKYGYEDQVRGDEVYYYPEDEYEVFKLYLALEVLSTLPGTNLVFGRPQRQTKTIIDLYESKVLGERSDIPLGYTEMETILGLMSVTTRALPTEMAQDQREIKALDKEIKERTKALNKTK